MSVNRTKKNLGRISFEVSVARKSSPGYGGNGSGIVRTVSNCPGQVTFSPYKNRRWRARIASVEDVTSTMIGTKFAYNHLEVQPFKARALFGYPGNNTSDLVATGDIFAVFGSVPDSAPSTDPLAQAKAAEKFLSEYYAKTRAVRGSSVLAESLGAVRGLASPAKALRKEVGNLWQSARGMAYRNRNAAMKDAAQAVAGTWLEWVFDKKPLIDDINGVMDAVNRTREGDFRVTMPLSATGSSSQMRDYRANQGVSSGQPAGVMPVEGPIGQVDTWLEDLTTCTIKGVIRLSPQGEVPVGMTWGLTGEDLGPGVLEAIPWSWFVDYFVNVSSVIEAWAFQQARLAWCARTVRNSTTRYVTDLRPFPWDQWGDYYSQYWASGGASKASYTSVIRSSVSWADIAPTLRLRVPGLGSTKWANLGALSQMYRDAKRLDFEWFHLRKKGGRMKRPNW